jgi:uncharacterized protein with ParB-like and HNH nuclease domain
MVRDRHRINHAPSYQRNYVWSIEKASYFIESILKNSEIPPLVLFCKNERFEIIDGRQRYETILRFVERRFKLSNKGLSALNFEAGALSKAFNNTNVSPFLFGLKPSDIKKSPLLQFQSTLYEKKDFTKLILSINNAAGNDKLDEGKLKRTFEVWWDKLKTKLDAHLIETTKNTTTN